MIDREDNTSIRLNLLMPYPYVNIEAIKKINQYQNCIRFLLDSGAFTAWKSGKSIKLDDYCRFIDSLPFASWRYFMLDVIGDAKKTMHNYEVMVKRGFSPIPVFTRGEDPSVIDDFYKISDVVGVGGLVGTKDRKGFINGIMRHIGSRRVHWLGFCSMPFIRHYRPYSCDSSTWCAGEKFAEVPIYFDNYVCERIHKSKFHKKPHARHAREIAALGFNPSDFSKKSAWDGPNSHSKILAIRSIVKFHIKIFQDLKVLYFIVALPHQIDRLIQSFEIESDTSR